MRQLDTVVVVGEVYTIHPCSSSQNRKRLHSAEHTYAAGATICVETAAQTDPAGEEMAEGHV